MKKARIRELLNDLKAAARLGHSDAVELALSGLRSLPQVAANDHLSEGFVAQVILPAGATLSRLSIAQLRPLMGDPLAALRAVAAVALGRRFLMGKDVIREDFLRLPASDPRSEVRTAFGQILREVGEANPECLLPLGETWLRASSPRIRTTALAFIPALASSHGGHIIEQLKPLKDEEHPEVRAALAAALQALARGGLAESVLGLLADWGAEPRPNVWVIARALSGSWAAAHPQKTETILRELYSKVGKRKALTNALRALQRHGVEIELEA